MAARHVVALSKGPIMPRERVTAPSKQSCVHVVRSCGRVLVSGVVVAVTAVCRLVGVVEVVAWKCVRDLRMPLAYRTVLFFVLVIAGCCRLFITAGALSPGPSRHFTEGPENQ